MSASRVVWLGLCIGLWLSPAWGDPVRFDGHKVVTVTLRNQQDIQKIESISDDCWCEGIGLGERDFRIAPEMWPALEASGLEFRVKIENVQELIDRERQELEQRGSGPWFQAYHRYSEINDYLDVLVGLRPDLARKYSIGQSLEGRTIWCIEITSPIGGRNKPGVFFNGCQHAREWISPATVMYIADQLIRRYPTDQTIRTLVNQNIFYIVPVVNPDGYEYTWTTNRLWRKNRRPNAGGSYGVDLNRNWAVGWGGPGSSGTPSSDTYRGTAPFSEPETQVIRDFVQAHPNIAISNDFHSYGQLILWPYGYQQSEPPEPDRTTFRNLGTAIRNAILAAPGVAYTPQPVWQLYLASGNAVDWGYGSEGIWAFSNELRDRGQYGFTLPASEILPTGIENLAGAIVMATHVTRPLCAGDIDGDRRVDQSDLGILLSCYGSGFCGDYDGDGDTDQADLGFLLANFGNQCP